MTAQFPVANSLPRDPKTGLTLPVSRSLGSRALAEHRSVIAYELEVLAKKFDRYRWEQDRDTPAYDRMVTDWMDALHDYPLDEIRAACRAAVIANPSKMPNEGHVLAQIRAEQARRVAMLPKPQEHDEVRERISKAVADAIVAEAGFAPRRMP